MYILDRQNPKMTLNKFWDTRRQRLRVLLDRVEVAAHSDTHDFSRGHLNESNLYKEPEMATHKPWKSAMADRQNKLHVSPPAPTKASSTVSSSRQENMKGTLASFSMGTTESVPLSPFNSPGRRSTVSSVNKYRKWTDKAMEQSGRASITTASSYLDDQVFVEELKLPELMLPRNSAPEVDATGRQPPDKLHFQHDFLSGHVGAVTKHDQFATLKKFENDIIRKRDATEYKVMQSRCTVEHLERKLRQGLEEIDPIYCRADMERLRVCSDVLNDIIHQSTIFGATLKTIKKGYDTYIRMLLRKPTGQHFTLLDQANQLSAHPASNPRQLEEERRRVANLEEQAREMLNENNRLRQALRDEKNRPLERELYKFLMRERDLARPVEMASAGGGATDLSHKSATRHEGSPTQDIAGTVQDLQAHIHEKLDAVQTLRQTLRTQYVPSTVCTHLEQCIKDTEVENQRLESNKNYFHANISEMENDLQEAIENADTTERDQRRVWKLISAVNAGDDDLDSYEDDDSSKWDWYIS